MRFVCDACQDITNIEADRMEIQGDKLMVYSRFDEVNTAAAELIERLTAENAELREKPRWIPVAERLPERDVQVLGWYKDNPFSQYRPEVVAWNGNGWVFVYAHRYVTNVTYWLPLPEAPEEIKAPFTEDTMINLAAQALGVEHSRLRELAEADKDGRLVMLPCKVGDTVYFALLGRIIEKQVFSIVSFSNSTRIYCGGTSEYFRPEDIGKTVFLTREEAEKALRGMEGKKDGD